MRKLKKRGDDSLDGACACAREERRNFLFEKLTSRDPVSHDLAPLTLDGKRGFRFSVRK